MNLYRAIPRRGVIFRNTPIVDDEFPLNRDRFDCVLGMFEQLPELPNIICLCGSTKFKAEFIKVNFELTMQGNIVLSVGWFSHTDSAAFFPSDDEKIMLDSLHKRKIDLADEVFVINVGGYIGESTKSEIEYAIQTNKPVKYLEQIACSTK